MKQYTKGIWFNQRTEKMPEWVIGKLSIKKNDFKNWLANQQPNDKDYINLDILMGKENKPYICVNEYKREEKEPF